ncbi:hypothetical protein RRG08_047231, partial [Elysia crispata]
KQAPIKPGEVQHNPPVSPVGTLTLHARLPAFVVISLVRVFNVAIDPVKRFVTDLGDENNEDVYLATDRNVDQYPVQVAATACHHC